MMKQKRTILVFLLFTLFIIPAGPLPCTASTGDQEELAPGRVLAKQATKEKKRWITADHSKFDILQQEFTSGPEVTQACLKCHNEAALQFHKTIHWTWEAQGKDPDTPLGKGGYSVNNFCINASSNEPRCTSCHAGYGWKDNTFDFTDQTKVDCLVCHESTGTYKKFPSGAGHPAKVTKVFKSNKKTYHPPEWNKVAQSVGLPGRKNCGTCHFYGGGGDGVKHGDLDSSLIKPDKHLDVHMGTDGQNFTCTRCHSTSEHHIAGRIYTRPAAESKTSLIEDDLTSKITCVSCHGRTPHQHNAKANDHTDRVACQSCHIPKFARINPTKMHWDWSAAGKMKDGKPYTVKDEFGKPAYMSKKGEFKWEKNVVPEYFWYNGSIDHLTLKDTIDPSVEVAVSKPAGDMTDEKSFIFPFKVHRGKIPYDKINKKLVAPHLFPKDKTDKAAYWKGFDWNAAIRYGQEYSNLPYSGEYDFVQTSYVFPITHMVAPRDNVLACTECHIRDTGRLANLAGFYMPGRNHVALMDWVGWILVAGSFIGVALHGLGRFFTRN
jgi:octaheme c-type cytochrome (tetrathionate reductase family)